MSLRSGHGRRTMVVLVALAVGLALVACGRPGRPGSSPAGPTVTGGSGGGGGSGSGSGSGSASALKLLEAWSWSSPPPASVGMPAADDDAVTAVSGRHRLVLLDRGGAVRWQVDRPGLRDVAPTLTSDTVLVAAEEGVVAYDRGAGRRRWETPLGERANTPVLAGGRAVVTTWEGSLLALDLADGRVAWRLQLGGDALGPAAAGPGSTVVATFDSGRVAGATAVDVGTGRVRWTVPLGANGVSAPAVTAGGVAVVVAGDVAAHGLGVEDGKERWRRALEGAGSPEVPPLPLSDGSIVVAHRQGGMALLEGDTGAVRWEAASDGAAVRGGPAGPGPNGWFALPLDDGRLLLGGPDRRPDLRKPPGSTVTGVATGPGRLLLVATGQGADNRLTALSGW